jgi:1-acyl-sn-glycerol-3-phosphate acyltransferase
MILLRFLRFLFISFPLLALLCLVWPAASLLLWICGRGPDTQLELGRIWAKTFLRLMFVRVRYEGFENLDGYGSAGVGVANHPGLLDILVLYGLPVRGVFFAAKQLFFNPISCIQLRAGGHLPTGGRNGRDTIKSVRLGIRLIREKGQAVLIFAELWHWGGELGQFQEGAAFLAIVAGSPIVPIAISGTRQFMGKTVTVRVGKPIRTAGMHVSDRAWLTKHLHDRVSEMLEMESASVPGARRTA